MYLIFARTLKERERISQRMKETNNKEKWRRRIEKERKKKRTIQFFFSCNISSYAYNEKI
jgi:hypothetical protein